MKLTNEQIAAVRALVVNKDGSLNQKVGAVALEQCRHILSPIMKRCYVGGHQQSPLSASASDLARDIIHALGFETEILKDAPKDYDLGEYYALVGALPRGFSYPDFIEQLGFGLWGVRVIDPRARGGAQ